MPRILCMFSFSERSWNKRSNRNGIFLAVLALFCIGVIQSGRDGENYFETLNVPPNASPKVVAGAYRKLSLQYHPDKNPHPDAKEIFEKIREAQEVLGNEKRRNSYCRFGDYSKDGDVDEDQFYDILFVAVLQFLVPFLFAYLYTYGDDSVQSRKIFGCYAAMNFSLELLLRFDESALEILSFLPAVGTLLPFEKVRILHTWMPIVLNGLLLLGSELADVEDDLLDETSRRVLDSNIDALSCMEKFLHAAEMYILKAGKLEIESKWVKADAAADSHPTEEESHLISAFRSLRAAGSRSTVSSVPSVSSGEKTGEEKSAEKEREIRARLAALGYTETRHYVKPWRLNPAVVSEESPDLWAAVMKEEVKNWPEDLTMDDLAKREGCTERGWDPHHEAIAKLLDEADEEDEKTGRGISVGTIIFFASLFLRWYTGGS
ncbi:DnaJ domain-containing protein [Toxoplasma gondii VAND]|uniref:DnaJ domain-containing protein n=1 Tax=Toxoplasma gondii VAND TaxID=933077 RepID=A0A086QKS6_TOXGO|nr:DnaJ domain-containing protein [Toxoplasma gondii VAND]